MNFDIEIVPDNVCRACLESDPVFEISSELSEKLKICGGIENEQIEHGNFPSKICHKCLMNLEISYEFWKKCQQSEKILKEVLHNSVAIEPSNATKNIIHNLKLEILAPKEEPTDCFVEDYEADNAQIEFNLHMDDTNTEDFIQNIALDVNNVEESVIEPKPMDKINMDQTKTSEKFNNKCKIKEKRKYKKILKDESAIKNIGDGALYSCEFCGIKYVSKFSMENHMRLHSARLRFVCEICGDSYAGKFQLEQHMCSIHTGERNFKCEYCDKAFFSKTLRNKHQKRSHSKQFKCNQCDKSFGRSDSLKKHMRVHTGEKPIVCDKCGTRFKELHHLKNHNKSMTPCIFKMSIKVKDG